MNHLRFSVQKIERTKDMESDSFKYNFVRKMGSRRDQINGQGFENEALMGALNSWKVEFSE